MTFSELCRVIIGAMSELLRRESVGIFCRVATGLFRYANNRRLGASIISMLVDIIFSCIKV